LAARAITVLEAAWQPAGYCVPHTGTYPHQWLWDSCFHAVAWSHLGRPDRAVRELEAALAHQGPDGFVPHIVYRSDPGTLEAFWGRSTTSCVTQPPVFGHAIAELARLGVAIPADLAERAIQALVHLLARRPDHDSLVPVLHPWETGCDDSPRWDAWCPRTFERERWRAVKGELVGALRFDPALGGRAGSAGPIGSDRFAPGSVAFSALVAFAGRELTAAGVAGVPSSDLDELEQALAQRWDAPARTWADEPGSVPGGAVGAPTGRARTVEALLPVLVLDGNEVHEALDLLVDPRAFGARFGPCQVHRDEPAFEPEPYWRGAAWPQLTYLLWVAAKRCDRHDVARVLAGSLRHGAVRSRFAEHWNPDTGIGGGAAPQTWTTLAAVVR
jgi:hypothetical protein